MVEQHGQVKPRADEQTDEERSLTMAELEAISAGCFPLNDTDCDCHL
jgi:hypothetical protein